MGKVKYKRDLVTTFMKLDGPRSTAPKLYDLKQQAFQPVYRLLGLGIWTGRTGMVCLFSTMPGTFPEDLKAKGTRTLETGIA